MNHPVAADATPSHTPLRDVTFCALDLETTGASAKTCDIVEIGAVKSRGGEPLGTLETFVRPAGISPLILACSPTLESVMPAVIEFVRGTVLVAHNARFDHAFLDAACAQLGYEPLRPVVLDTAKLARRLVKAEVPNLQLATLARHFRTSHTPCHRAFADAAACLEILWNLLERAGAYGVETLADLIELQRPGAAPHADKARIAKRLPRTRGVYLLRGAAGDVLYVGKAADLRSRVRSYFMSSDRKRSVDLALLAVSVDTIDCTTDLEAQAIEARLIEQHQPRYNRRGIAKPHPVWIRIDTRLRHPRVQIVGSHRGRGFHLGPFASRASAQAASDTITTAWRIRSCTLALGHTTTIEPCAFYDLGTCHGPCTGREADVGSHDDAVAQAVADLRADASALRQRVEARLTKLADRYRYEEAAAHQHGYAEVEKAVQRARRLQAIAGWGTVRLAVDGSEVTIVNGRLDGGPGQLPLVEDFSASAADDPSVAGEHLLERSAIAAWLDRFEWQRIDRSASDSASSTEQGRNLPRGVEFST